MGSWILFIILLGDGTGSRNPQMEHLRFYNEAACKAAAEQLEANVKKINGEKAFYGPINGYSFSCHKDS